MNYFLQIKDWYKNKYDISYFKVFLHCTLCILHFRQGILSENQQRWGRYIFLYSCYYDVFTNA